MAEQNAFRFSLSSHPVALGFFLGFRLAALLTYIFGLIFTSNFVLIFIIVILLLAADFWNTKNVSGRLLVGLRWWNESSSTGDSIWVFESADPQREINGTDSRFFWTVLYSTPVVWSLLALLAILKFELIWLSLVIIAVILSSTNAMAFTRCDRFGKASGIANSMFARSSRGLMQRIAGGFISRVYGG
ncbi:hypothetical protein POJ06DRAFT_250404 [Lipomyces tetrasporus]|uniref:Golgi apparatus membrane protein TVP23 n=1 Tax=Lipomyces tetrasporus TaxID=54092 RepID=A0AAD7QT86_9ASCO|nr:uncharacterized protein POJ06DRAFT_250404 [Lipomyces tetrasporus]KAJ8101082.1 hypothetical protein POJ06DRAFT_250404 [Lipomyces tetrasporus]